MTYTTREARVAGSLPWWLGVITVKLSLRHLGSTDNHVSSTKDKRARDAGEKKLESRDLPTACAKQI